MNLSPTFSQHFETIDDPRVDNHNRCHEIIDIFVIAIWVRYVVQMVSFSDIIIYYFLNIFRYSENLLRIFLNPKICAIESKIKTYSFMIIPRILPICAPVIFI